MTSSRPYLLRTIYEWLVDNHLTPYIMVDAMMAGVEVPERFVQDGKIILNIESHAVSQLRMGNDAVEFNARFSGISHRVFIPIQAVKAIYAFENGRGMVFNEEEDIEVSAPQKSATLSDLRPVQKGRPDLKIVK